MGRFGQLDPRLAPWADALVEVAEREFGVRVRITSMQRSCREQEVLFHRRQLRPDLQRFPVAPPGRSTHNVGLAWDMVVIPDQATKLVGQLWRSWGGWWSETDSVHFAAIRSLPPGIWCR